MLGTPTGARGEGFVETPDGKQYAILFTNRAIAEAERALKKSVIGMMRDFEAAGVAGLGVNEIGHLLYVGMEHGRRDAHAGGKQLSLSDAWDLMDVIGFAEATRVVLEAISAVLSYSPESEFAGEAENP